MEGNGDSSGKSTADYFKGGKGRNWQTLMNNWGSQGVMQAVGGLKAVEPGGGERKTSQELAVTPGKGNSGTKYL